MASNWKTVRVFISSTFRDMHSERDWLVKRVFPALREKLERHRVNLIDIDLRWGITEEQAHNDQVLDLCLDQIDDCRPFFVGLLGERYGWVPENFTPEAVRKYGWIQHYTGKSLTELEILHGVINDPQMHPYSFFFFRDPAFANQVPADVRPEIESEAVVAKRKLTELKQRIRSAGLPVPPVENYSCRFGGLRLNWRLVRAELDESTANALYEVAKDGIVDPREYASLDPHQKQIVRNHGVVYLTDLDDFGRTVGTRLWEGIKARLGLPEVPLRARSAQVDPSAEENDSHQRFMDSRLRVYAGREKLQAELMNYAMGADTVPCLLSGPAGSGKSASLARFAQMLNQQNDENQRREAKWLVIQHFVGASPSSTSLRKMLHRFCSTLNRAFDFRDDVPAETNKLIATFARFIRQIPSDRRVIILIDALNQMDEADHALHLYWLPWTLPTNLKLVASCITGGERQGSSASGPKNPGASQPFDRKTETVLNAFRHHRHHPVSVSPLTDDERLEIIRQVPSLSAKTLDHAQLRLLLANPATTNPLFLLVALEELRGFGSYEQVGRRIQQFPRGGDAVTDLFAQVIQRLENEFDVQVVARVLTLLATARRGLSDREFLDLVEGRQVALDTSSSDLFPVIRQLRPYLQHRGDLWDFHHGNLLLAVQRQYLQSSERQRAAHATLAKYFLDQPLYHAPRSSPSRPDKDQGPNIRKADELPWQLTQAEQWLVLDRTLCNLDFIQAKCRAQLTYDLTADFTSSLQAIDGALSAQRPADPPRPKTESLKVRGSLRQFSNFVSQHAHIFVRDPSLVVPIAHNHAADGPVVEQAVHLLAANGWDANPWMELLDRPVSVLVPAWQGTLEAHDGVVNGVTLDANCGLAVSGGSDGKACVWDVPQKTCIRVIHAHETGVNAVAMCAAANFVVTGGQDGLVRVWDLTSGECRTELKGHTDEVLAVSSSKNGAYIAGAGIDGQVLIWELASARLVRTLVGHFGPVTGVAFSDQMDLLVSGGWDATVRLWDLKTGKQLKCLQGHTTRVLDVSFNSQSQLIASASGVVPDSDGLLPSRMYQASEVRLWSLGGDCRSVQQTHGIGDIGGAIQGVLSSAVHGVAISQDGKLAVSAGHDGNLCLWDLSRDELKNVLHAHSSPIMSVAVDGQARMAITGSVDQTVQIWDLNGHTPPRLSVKRRIGRIGPSVRTKFAHKVELVWANRRVRRWMAYPLLSIAGAAMVLSIPSLAFPSATTRYEQAFHFASAWLYVSGFLWIVDWRNTLKRGSLAVRKHRIPIWPRWLLAIPFLPLFLLLRFVKCPLCGNILCGVRRFYHCPHCGFCDA